MPRSHVSSPRALRGYHVYNQGAKVAGRARRIFIDDDDRRYFLWLLARHLCPEPKLDSRGRTFIHLRHKLTLIAFNLMATHFHLIIWQRSPEGIAELMNCVKTAYARYFNAKYKNTRPLYNGPFQAKEIGSRSYFKWLVGYVHDNHRDGVDYEFSSHRAWLNPDQCPAWLDPEPGLRAFGSERGYLRYLEDRDERKRLNQALGLTGR